MTLLAEPVSGRRALVVGVGLIGGSIALGLKAAGWHVSGIDTNAETERASITSGVIDECGDDPEAAIIFVCVPASEVVNVARRVLASRPGGEVVVTDVAGVKLGIVERIDDPRFLGGHPMAGSEQSGVGGAREDLFLGATWVVTPTAQTTPAAYSALLGVVRQLGAQALALDPRDHDRLVALVSHVPHLVASALMDEAADASKNDAALLQLAAGGFRDMTRVAAGDPGIWPDVCRANRDAILEALDDLQRRLMVLRSAVADSDDDALLTVLTRSSAARQALPGRTSAQGGLSTLRIPVPDRPGILAEMTGLAGDLGISVADVEIAHSVEGSQGVLLLVVASSEAERLADAVRSTGSSCAVEAL